MKNFIYLIVTFYFVSCNSETLLPKWEKETTAKELLNENVSKESIEKRIANIDKAINRIEKSIRNLEKRVNVFERVKSENDFNERNYFTLQINYLYQDLNNLYRNRSDLMEILYNLENKVEKPNKNHN